MELGLGISRRDAFMDRVLRYYSDNCDDSVGDDSVSLCRASYVKCLEGLLFEYGCTFGDLVCFSEKKFPLGSISYGIASLRQFGIVNASNGYIGGLSVRDVVVDGCGVWKIKKALV